MPYLTKRFIQYFDHGPHFSRNVYELDKPEYFQLVPGEYTTPKNAKSSWENYKPVPSPLFIKNTTKIADNVGQYGTIYLFLRPKMILKNVYIEPEEVVVDISFFTDKSGTYLDSLIYSFYNPSDSDIASIYATLADDESDVLGKIKSNPDDIDYRTYILKTTLSKSSNKDFKYDEVTFPENMTAKQVAKYLQVKEKTIRNWTSEGKIPFVKLPTGTVRYKLSEIEKWMVEKGKK